ncbi:winged helix-turn-helix domain-containing protein, partial [Paenirhodobacter populi]
MKIIMEMRARGSLTEQQVLTAARFRKDPQRIRLAPTLWRTLHDVVIRERNLGEIEQSRGWPPRSARLLVSQLLYAIEETDGMFWGDPEEDLRERAEYLTGADTDPRIAALMTRHRLTKMEARLLLMLQDAPGTTVSRESLMRRLYSDRIDEWPDVTIISVFVCKLRKKMPAAAGRIEAIRGAGVRWVPDRQD